MMKTRAGHIFINDLRLYAFHGVLPQERIVGGNYSVDIDVTLDLSQAMASDRVEDTVNYATLLDIVKQEMDIPSALLEHVAGRMAEQICCRFTQIEEVMVRITKINPPMGAETKGAGVTIYLINDKRGGIS